MDVLVKMTVNNVIHYQHNSIRSLLEAMGFDSKIHFTSFNLIHPSDHHLIVWKMQCFNYSTAID